MIEVDALDTLVDQLESCLAKGERGKPVVKLLEDYAKQHQDWRRLALFSEHNYARNLVAKSEHFHLIVICWGPGQVSPIHNHEGQSCWMAVLDGQMEEIHYPRPDEVQPGPLEPRKSCIFERGQVAYINDDIALHVVKSAGDQPGVSLHLYSKGYDFCNIYCPDTGEITRKALSNYSERGKLC